MGLDNKLGLFNFRAVSANDGLHQRLVTLTVAADEDLEQCPPASSRGILHNLNTHEEDTGLFAKAQKATLEASCQLRLCFADEEHCLHEVGF